MAERAVNGPKKREILGRLGRGTGGDGQRLCCERAAKGQNGQKIGPAKGGRVENWVHEGGKGAHERGWCGAGDGRDWAERNRGAFFAPTDRGEVSGLTVSRRLPERDREWCYYWLLVTGSYGPTSDIPWQSTIGRHWQAMSSNVVGAKNRSQSQYQNQCQYQSQCQYHNQVRPKKPIKPTNRSNHIHIFSLF